MKRSVKYSLKFLTRKKKETLNSLFLLYKENLQKTVDLMWNGEVPIKRIISSREINWTHGLGGQYKQLVYKHASEIIRSLLKNKKHRKVSKPAIKNITINLDNRIAQVEKSNNSFDLWVRIKLPFIQEGYKLKRQELLIPLKQHKHGLKFKDWQLCNTIKLSEDFVILTFEKETPKPKTSGRTLGIDSGYKNLLVTSEGQFIGKDFCKIYEKIARKKQGSKKVEDLKNLKKGIKGRFRKKFNNKLQRWTYRFVLNKLERKAEEEAVQFLRVPPAWTSQVCPVCRFKHDKNRKGEKFKCLNCGYENHADVVGAINIARQEPIVPVAQKANLGNVCP